MAEGLEEDGRARRDAHLDPAVDEDAVLRVEHLRLGAEEDEVERRRAAAVVHEDLAATLHLLVVDEVWRLELVDVAVERRRVDLHRLLPVRELRELLAGEGAEHVGEEARAEHRLEHERRVAVRGLGGAHALLRVWRHPSSVGEETKLDELVAVLLGGVAHPLQRALRKEEAVAELARRAVAALAPLVGPAAVGLEEGAVVRLLTVEDLMGGTRLVAAAERR